MEDFTIAAYCFIDDYLKTGHPKAGGKRKATDSQVITAALVTAKEFYGNFGKDDLPDHSIHLNVPGSLGERVV